MRCPPTGRVFEKPQPETLVRRWSRRASFCPGHHLSLGSTLRPPPRTGIEASTRESTNHQRHCCTVPHHGRHPHRMQQHTRRDRIPAGRTNCCCHTRRVVGEPHHSGSRSTRSDRPSDPAIRDTAGDDYHADHRCRRIAAHNCSVRNRHEQPERCDSTCDHHRRNSQLPSSTEHQ